MELPTSEAAQENYIHPSILTDLGCGGWRGGAYPGEHWARGGVHSD